MTTSSPYEHCVLSGTDVVGPTHGYPDGDMQPSVTLDYKAVYTFKPVGGVVDVVLAPSANSAVVLLAGTAVGTTLVTTPSNTTNIGFTTNQSGGIGQGPIRINTIPTVISGLGDTPSHTSSDEFRPIVLVADFDYTGSSMMDNGSMTIQPIPNSEKLVGSQLVSATTNYYADKAVFSNPSLATTLSPSAVVQPARESFTTRIVAKEPKYETTRPSVVVKGGSDSTDGTAYAWPSTTNAIGTLTLAPSYHPSCEWTRVTYTGLDASASITVTIRYCVQFAVNQSAELFGPIAQPSPANKPGVTAKVANFVRLAPIAVKKSIKVWDVFKRIGKSLLPMVLPGAGNIISSFL